MVALVKSPLGGLLYRGGHLYKGPAVGAECCCPQGLCDCPLCVLIEWEVDDPGTGAPAGDPFSGSGSVKLNTDFGDCDYLMTTVGGASPAAGVSTQLSPYLCFFPSFFRVVITSFSTTGPSSFVPYVNDSTFPFPDPLPTAASFPYDSGTRTLYRHSDPAQPVGTVRIRTFNTVAECEGAIE